MTKPNPRPTTPTPTGRWRQSEPEIQTLSFGPPLDDRHLLDPDEDSPLLKCDLSALELRIMGIYAND